MPTYKQRIQKDINDLIKSVSEAKGMILTYPLLVAFFDGDHNAAIFTNQVLYWTDRTSDPDGWFYKTHKDWEAELQFSYYQVQRVIFGDERVQNPKRNLMDIGLETKVKMAPNGRNATFYRLDVPQFVAMFVDWIEAKFGALTTKAKAILNPKALQSEADETPQPDAVPDDDSLPPFWFRRQEPEVVPTERVQTRWEDTYRPDEEHTVFDVWNTAQGQLEIQFDRASFNTYLKHIMLVDYEPSSQTFTLAVKDTVNIDMVRQRLHRNIRCVLSDVFGREAEITYVTYDEWQDRHR